MKLQLERKKLIQNGGHMAWSIFRALLILSLAFLILNPVFVKVMTAFKDVSDYSDPTVLYIPKHVTTEYLRTMLNFLDYGSTLLKSLLFTGGNALLQTMSCALVAYSLARFKYRLRGVVFGLVILTLIVPAQTTLIPLFFQFKHFSLVNCFVLQPSGGVDLINTPLPIILLSAAGLGLKNGLFIFMLRQFFRNMPIVLEEAAYVDGCGPAKTFFHIMLPNSITMLVTVFLFSFVWVWNDNLYTSFLAPDLGIMSTLLTDLAWRISYYLGTSMTSSSGLLSSIYGSVGVLLHMIPILILYAFTQRFFVQGIERSGIVG